MVRKVGIGLAAGFLFLVLDVVIHANPLAQRLMAVYQPLARPDVNTSLGTAIDLGYGLILTAVFVQLCPSLPGRSGLAKGLSFGLLVWFLRVAMAVASERVAMSVPAPTHVYTLTAGLAQVLAVSSFLGVLLTPRSTTS